MRFVEEFWWWCNLMMRFGWMLRFVMIYGLVHWFIHFHDEYFVTAWIDNWRMSTTRLFGRYFLLGFEVKFFRARLLISSSFFLPFREDDLFGRLLSVIKTWLFSYLCDSFSLNPQRSYHFGVSLSWECQEVLYIGYTVSFSQGLVQVQVTNLGNFTSWSSLAYRVYFTMLSLQ